MNDWKEQAQISDPNSAMLISASSVSCKDAIKGIHKVQAVPPIVFTPRWKVMFPVIIFVSHKFSSRETIAKQGSCRREY